MCIVLYYPNIFISEPTRCQLFCDKFWCCVFSMTIWHGIMDIQQTTNDLIYIQLLCKNTFYIYIDTDEGRS